MGNIEALKAEVTRLENELDAAVARLNAAYVAALPWRVGDIVEMTATSYAAKGSVHKIIGVYRAESGWARAVSRKADGSWGKRERTLYRDFKVIGHEN